MITHEQSDKLLKTLFATYETLGQTVTPAAANLMADDLSGYPFDQIMDSLTKCRREVKGRFNLSEIITRIESQQGWLGANEAWALALPLLDENESGAVTDIIQEALNVAGSCHDNIAARMAFIECYSRLTSAAKERGDVPKWRVSLGHDKTLREGATEKALIAGYITQQYADNLLPDLRSPEMSFKNLLAGTIAASEHSEGARQALKDIKGMLKSNGMANDGKSDIDAELAQIKSNFEDKL